MAYILKDKIKIEKPIIFLCGPYYNDADKSDRRKILQDFFLRKFPNSCLIKKTPIGLEFHIEGRGWIITDGKEKFSFVVHGYGSKEKDSFFPNYIYCGCV